MRKVVAIDPSGNFLEGKGNTGFVEATVSADLKYEITRFGTISAKDFSNRVEYWSKHKTLLTDKISDAIIEDYRLYNHRGANASMQSYSQIETARLLGLLEYFCVQGEIEVNFQMANQMVAWNEDVLVSRGILEKKGNRYYLKGEQTNDHVRSALKHFLIWLHKEGKK